MNSDVTVAKPTRLAIIITKIEPSTSTESTRKGLAMSKPVSGYLSLPAQPFLVDVLHMFIRPKPRHVWAEFYMTYKIKRWRLSFSFNYSTFSFSLSPQWKRGKCSPRQSKILKFSWGSMPPDLHTSLHLHWPHAPPPPPTTKNPGNAPAQNIAKISRHFELQDACAK